MLIVCVDENHGIGPRLNVLTLCIVYRVILLATLGVAYGDLIRATYRRRLTVDVEDCLRNDGCDHCF